MYVQEQSVTDVKETLECRCMWIGHQKRMAGQLVFHVYISLYTCVEQDMRLGSA
jgi:hypothetical protein